MNKNNIILIGFMGVGKGTIARALFKSSGRFSIDTDDLIESITKKKIKTIFTKEKDTLFIYLSIYISIQKVYFRK